MGVDVLDQARDKTDRRVQIAQCWLDQAPPTPWRHIQEDEQARAFIGCISHPNA